MACSGTSKVVLKLKFWCGRTEDWQALFSKIQDFHNHFAFSADTPNLYLGFNLFAREGSVTYIAPMGMNICIYNSTDRSEICPGNFTTNCAIIN